MNGPLGLPDLVTDHTRTLYQIRSDTSRRTSASDITLLYGVPIALGVVVGVLRAPLHGITTILAGVTLLTGLLFGLLVHVFTLGLRLADDPRRRPDDRISLLVGELRANVAYACAVGLVLTLVLVAVAVFGADSETVTTVQGSRVTVVAASGGSPSWVTGSVLALLLHLVLTLFGVLKRLRRAYLDMAL